MTTELHFTKSINVPPETIFNLLIDLEHYNQWLSPSALYGSVAKISENPVKLGSTYIDKGTSSLMKGSVTEYEPPRTLTFEQSQQTKLLIFNITVNIRIRYTLDAIATGTQLTRDVSVDIQGIPNFMKSIVINQIRNENERILAKMKAYLEKPYEQ
jgi:uncharacterized protein YndB with AHSA1/START domain